jgi:hypothetical protein
MSIPQWFIASIVCGALLSGTAVFLWDALRGNPQRHDEPVQLWQIRKKWREE